MPSGRLRCDRCWIASRCASSARGAEPVLEPVLIRFAELEPQRTVGYRARYDEALGEMRAQLMGRRPEMVTAPDEAGAALQQLLSRLAERRFRARAGVVNRLS